MADEITRLELPSLAELRDGYCLDVARLVPGKNVARGSDTYARATAVAAAAQMILARQVALQDAQMPDASYGADLDRLCTQRGVVVSYGAGATGYVLADCSGTVTYPVDTEIKVSGLRYKVATTSTVVDGDQIPIVGVDVGKRTNQVAGTVMTWTSPPAGSNATASVDVDGLRFGTDADNDAAKRRKLQDVIKYPPRDSNWAQIAKDAQDSSGAIEKAFPYPAVYGPCTMHVAITVAADAEEQYTRAATGTLQLLAANAITSKHPEHADLTMTTVTDWDIDIILKVQIPEPKSAGGNGGGWKDDTTIRWPRTVNAASPNAVRLAAAPTNPKQISVTSDVAPVTEAYIALWSSTQKKLVRSRIYAQSGAGPYTIDLYDPIDITMFISGDWVMADAEHLDEYCAAVAESFAGLGPSEKTTDANILPRAARHPKATAEWPTDFSSKQTDKLSTTFEEISHVAFYKAFDSTPTTYSALPIACPDNTTTGAAPYCLRLGKIAFYEV